MPRRSREETRALKIGLLALAEEMQPLTLRSLFYRAVSAGLVPKLETEYKTIGRLCVDMRRDGLMPFTWLVDQGRFARVPSTWAGPDRILDAARQSYTLDRWANQPAQVEVWCEKDAIVGVVEPVTERWLVPLYSCRGYPSLSVIHNAVTSWDERPVRIVYYGDYDPSGVDIPRALEREMREQSGRYLDSLDYGEDNVLEFEVCATTPDQIEEYDLPTRPSKTTDSRAAGFGDESVELDAFDPRDLRAIVEADVSARVDEAAWEASGETETEHRTLLDRVVDEAKAGL